MLYASRYLDGLCFNSSGSSFVILLRHAGMHVFFEKGFKSFLVEMASVFDFDSNLIGYLGRCLRCINSVRSPLDGVVS